MGKQEKKKNSTPALQHVDELKHYRIEHVAERTGLTPRTLRYYEEIGLLCPSARTEGNYRLYTEAEIAKLERIKQYRETLGLTLKEVQEWLESEEERSEIRDLYQSDTDSEHRLALLDRAEELTRQQIALIEQKVQTLEILKTSLLERMDRYKQRRKELGN